MIILCEFLSWRKTNVVNNELLFRGITVKIFCHTANRLLKTDMEIFLWRQGDVTANVDTLSYIFYFEIGSSSSKSLLYITYRHKGLLSDIVIR